MQISREEFISKKKYENSHTLYIVPDPIQTSLKRLRKCVEGEGMPIFKQGMTKGNLFIEFDIIFPKSLDLNICDKLKKLLPNDNNEINFNENDNEVEIHLLTNIDPIISEQNNIHAYEDSENEELNRGNHGSGGMECSQQ